VLSEADRRELKRVCWVYTNEYSVSTIDHFSIERQLSLLKSRERVFIPEKANELYKLITRVEDEITSSYAEKELLGD
jgi:hypothetical protein